MKAHELLSSPAKWCQESPAMEGIRQLSRTDKACCLMEWNDDQNASFGEIWEILLEADL
jgi:hypothetical protein